MSRAMWPNNRFSKIMKLSVLFAKLRIWEHEDYRDSKKPTKRHVTNRLKPVDCICAARTISFSAIVNIVLNMLIRYEPIVGLRQRN